MPKIAKIRNKSTTQHRERIYRQAWRRGQLSDDPRCDYCDLTMTMQTATLDHIIPMGLPGATDTEANWAMACHKCNNRKGQATPEQAAMPLLRRRSAVRTAPPLAGSE